MTNYVDEKLIDKYARLADNNCLIFEISHTKHNVKIKYHFPTRYYNGISIIYSEAILMSVCVSVYIDNELFYKHTLNLDYQFKEKLSWSIRNNNIYFPEPSHCYARDFPLQDWYIQKLEDEGVKIQYADLLSNRANYVFSNSDIANNYDSNRYQKLGDKLGELANFFKKNLR